MAESAEKKLTELRKKLRLQIPGSTSNLGPGFDSVALALGIYCRLTFSLIEHNDPSIPFVSLKGPVTKRSVPSDIDDLIYKVLSRIWRDAPEMLHLSRIEIDSEIPLGCGLGGSTAAILGALWGAYYFQDRVPNQADLLAEATALEGHSEGFAASLMGQFVVCAKSLDGNQVIARQHPWPDRWKTIFVVPEYRLQTPSMRSCLPDKVPHCDAVFNIQRTALLVSAVCRADDNSIKEAMADRLHENYRRDKAPLLNKVRKALETEPVLASCLSGAGPSVLVLVQAKHKEAVLEYLKEWSHAEEEPLSILDIEADREGIQEINSDSPGNDLGS